MPAPLPIELRTRVLAASQMPGMTTAEVARLFGVGTATVTRLRRLHRDGAGLAPRSTVGGRVSKRTKERLDVLAELVREQPDRYGRELAELWTNAVGVSMTRSDVVRGLRDLRLTLKKVAQSV